MLLSYIGTLVSCDCTVNVDSNAADPIRVAAGKLVSNKAMRTTRKLSLMCVCMQVRLDHRYGTVHFGGQQLESDRVRDHISALGRRLTKALGMIQPEVPKETEARRLKVSSCSDCTACANPNSGNTSTFVLCECTELQQEYIGGLLCLSALIFQQYRCCSMLLQQRATICVFMLWL